MPDLVVDNLTKEFPTARGTLHVLRGVSLELSAGDNGAILGPSGTGKSTLLQIIGTLDRPTSGTVTLDDEDWSQLSEPQLADFRNRKIGFVFQEHYLLPQCSVLDNVLLPTLARNASSPAERQERARELLRRVGLQERLHHLPGELSGGERQRAAVARALILGPRIVLADEPTGNLDQRTAAELGELLLGLQAQEQTMLIVVTHSLELADRFQRRWELRDGLFQGESSAATTPATEDAQEDQHG